MEHSSRRYSDVPPGLEKTFPISPLTPTCPPSCSLNGGGLNAPPVSCRNNSKVGWMVALATEVDVSVRLASSLMARTMQWFVTSVPGPIERLYDLKGPSVMHPPPDPGTKERFPNNPCHPSTKAPFPPNPVVGSKTGDVLMLNTRHERCSTKDWM